MVAFYPRVTFMTLLVFNGGFLVAGIWMIVYGTVRSRSSSADLEESGSPVTMMIVAGVIDTLVGISGLVGALMKNRFLLMLNIGILGAASIVNLILCLVLPLGGYEQIRETSVTIKAKVLSLYGNNTDKMGRKFTADINKHQKEDGCCGWSYDESTNIFLETIWYKLNNVNNISRTLPDSCCSAQKTEICHFAKDLTEARNKKFVFKWDCITKIAGRMKFFVWVSFSQLLLTTLVQGGLIGFLLRLLLQTKTDD